MDKVKGLAKNAKNWQPDTGGEKGIRNKVGAVLGRRSDNHPVRDATPLSQLRDPSSFAPPPKRVDSGVLPPPALPSSSNQYHQYDHQQQQQQEQYLIEEAPPPKPYRIDTTGLSTNHLPPPPRRRDGAAAGEPVVSPPPPYTPSSTGKPPPPSLPPRLPPRHNSASPSASPQLPSPENPSRQTGFLNQGAMDRLGAAGVSVPGLGIGSSRSRPALPPPRSNVASPSPSHSSAISSPPSTMNELQTRFSKFGVGKSSPNESTVSSAPPPSSQGTTLQEKQATLKTMYNFKKDPSSVSFADARSAASTANNFRERHGEQVAAGVSKANSLDQKYGVSGNIGGYLGSANNSSGNVTTAGASTGGAQSHLNTIGAAAGLLGKKKPPPPPPKKKPGLGGGNPARGEDGDTPPPIPMSTRPF